MDKPAPLHTVRFHQMRLSFAIGAMPLCIIIALVSNGAFVIPLLIVGAYLIADLVSIRARKSGKAPAPRLIYEVGKKADYEQIMQAVAGFLFLWLFSIGMTLLLIQDNSSFQSEPFFQLLRPISIVFSNLISLMTFRWLIEVRKMVLDYREQKRLGIASVFSPSPIAGMQPFRPVNASAPPVAQPLQIGIGKAP